MTDLTIPNTFIPGTKAKAQEVNENFTAVKNAVNQKANVNGDETKTFKVATATQNDHAVNKAQFEELSESLQETCNSTLTNFCVHSGNVNSQGEADLMSYSSGIMSFKVGDSYPNAVISNAKGIITTLTSFTNLNVSPTPYSVFTPNYMSSNVLPSGYSATSTADTMNVYKMFDNNSGTYFQTNACETEVIYEIPTKIIPTQVYALSNTYPNEACSLMGFELYGYLENADTYEHILTDLSNPQQDHDYNETIYLSTNQSSKSYKKFKIVFKTVNGTAYQPRIQSFQIIGLEENDTGLSSLDYETQNIFVTSTGTTYALSNSIFTQNTRPNMKKDDIWINTQSFPLKITKFDGEDDIEFSDVLIGSVKFVSGVYESHTTNQYNQNGYNLNACSTTFVNNWKNVQADYSKTIQWTWGQTYTAPSDGWVFALGQAQGGYSVAHLKINDFIFNVTQSGLSDAGLSSGFLAPVSKGDSIKAYDGTGGFTQFAFIPCKGV